MTMDESSMTLLTDIHHLDVIGWEVSEKYHGCRSYWDGKQFWTRGGNVIKAPAWFTAGLPSCHMDGEIYAGVGNFTEARLAVQYGRFTPNIVFMVFDAPQEKGKWSERIASLPDLSGTACRVVDCNVIGSLDYLRVCLEIVKKRGGEGLVLRNPGCRIYRSGKQFGAMRVKEMFQIDLLEQRRAA